MSDESELFEELKLVIVERLGLTSVVPASIGNDTPLFDEGLGLDSVDALELAVGLEKIRNYY